MSKIVSKEVQEFVENNLNGEFFKRNVLGPYSAYKILDITLSADAVDKDMYKKFSEDEKMKMKEENNRAEAEEDINKLYNMLRKKIYPSTFFIIVNKLMKHKDVIFRKMLGDFKRSGNDYFVEAAARILVKAEDNYSNEIASMLPYIKYPYTQAIACYVLGKIGREEHIKILYEYFNKLKNNYEREAFYEGPLFGLYEMKRRFEF